MDSAGTSPAHWRSDQSPGVKADTFKFSRPSSVREAFQIEVGHLPRFGKPLRGITLDAQARHMLRRLVSGHRRIRLQADDHARPKSLDWDGLVTEVLTVGQFNSSKSNPNANLRYTPSARGEYP